MAGVKLSTGLEDADACGIQTRRGVAALLKLRQEGSKDGAWKLGWHQSVGIAGWCFGR